MGTKPQKVITQAQIDAKVLRKLPPFSIDAEQAVLGAILIENDTIFVVNEIMTTGEFYHQTHNMILAAMNDLHVAKIEIDLLTLRDELTKRGQLDQCGGAAYLATLSDHAITASNITFHAKIVHEKFLLRQLLNTSLEISARCYDIDDPTAILSEAESKLNAVMNGFVKASFESMSTLAPRTYEYLESLQKSAKPSWIPTGYPDLDHNLIGLRPGDLIFIAARPSMGKTSFCLDLLRHIGKRGIPAAMISLEMENQDLMTRLFASEAKVNPMMLERGEDIREGWERLANACQLLSNTPIFIDETPKQTMTMIRAKANRLKREKDIQVLFIDYLQLIDPEKHTENKVLEVEEHTRLLKLLARELKIPVVVLCQLSRKLETRDDKRPILSDLRWSGSIEQDADVVLFLYRPEVYYDNAEKGLAEVIIAKQRKGNIGNVPFVFLADYTTFESMSTLQKYSHNKNKAESEKVF